MTPTLIFCEDPMSPGSVDEAYVTELAAAKELGFPTGLISFEELVDFGDVRAAVRRVQTSGSTQKAIYRGWMLTPAQYAQLHGALFVKGLELINTPEQYKHCHWLPESYPLLADATPKSVHLPTTELPGWEALGPLLREFGGAPVILKDYVKSQKYYWREACFISRSDQEAVVMPVVERFFELQGEIQGGLVFRQFVELETLGIHPKTETPLAHEFRRFFLNGAPVYTLPHWQEADYSAAEAPPEIFTRQARNIRSNFFTMDMAKLIDGRWIIVELGDAQVAGLPENLDPSDFYKALLF